MGCHLVVDCLNFTILLNDFRRIPSSFSLFFLLTVFRYSGSDMVGQKLHLCWTIIESICCKDLCLAYAMNGSIPFCCQASLSVFFALFIFSLISNFLEGSTFSFHMTSNTSNNDHGTRSHQTIVEGYGSKKKALYYIIFNYDFTMLTFCFLSLV